MIVRLDERRTLRLEEASDFRRFKLVVAGVPSEREAVATALGEFATFEALDKAWVSAERLKTLVPERTADWDTGFARMIEGARPHGWIKDDPVRIGAHVEWDASPAYGQP